MGGRPTTAMNIVCFPNCLSIDILKEIMRGGAEKVKEAGAVLVGGHSIEDDEPKYGLSVMGLVRPDKVTANSGARVGDLLILTKPLGLGIINTAIKADMVDSNTYERAVFTMSYLNKDAGEAMNEVGVIGCTDITGFGLLGHALEMAQASNVSFEIFSDSLPIIKESVELAKMGIIPGGAYRNEAYISEKISFSDKVPQEIRDIMYDPQTSGGLLIAVSKDKADTLLEILSKNNKTEFSLIGKVIEKTEHFIKVN